MERKVGEIFEYNGEWYQCMHVPQKHSCKLCDLRGLCCDNNGVKIVTCVWRHREDNTSVIFKKLEKIKDPFVFNNMLYQRLKSIDNLVCAHCTFFNESCSCPSALCGSNLGYFLKTAGIKQYLKIKEDMKKKEDMKEEKLNLKKFDLEAAKAGKPVCTRDGRKARIICFDRHGEDCPIIALVVDSKNAECEEVIDYTLDGICNENIINHNKYDLMMLPEKKEGWINLCKNNHGDTLAVGVFPNREEAVSNCPPSYLGTIKIEWEE